MANIGVICAYINLRKTKMTSEQTGENGRKHEKNGDLVF